MGSPSSETTLPHRPRRYSRYKAPYVPGDCLAVQLSDGDWGAALVLGTDDLLRHNLVGLLRYKATAVPDMAVFERREWLTLTHHSHQGRKAIEWCDAKYHPAVAHLLTVVGQSELREDDPNDCPVWGGWSLNIQIEMQFAWKESQKADGM